MPVLFSSSLPSALLRGAALLVALSGSLVCAHPEIDEALDRLNAQIAASPDNADLYLDRGELYALHDDLVAAEANYLRAQELAPKHPRLPRAFGMLAFAKGELTEARRQFDASLVQRPDDAEVRVLRARTLSALNDRAGALADFDRALALIENPPPEIYLERASLYTSPRDALRSLEAGLERLGPVISIQLRALSLEESLGLVDAALRRVDQLTAQTERKETWLKRRGDILARAGRTAEAAAAYSQAIKAIAALPAWLRESPETQRLAAELAKLAAPRS